MPFTGDSFTHLFDWEKDPQRQEKIVNARLEAEFGGIATGLTTVATDLSALEAVPRREVLTAHRVLYVRADGNNANPGTADTAGGAKLTIGGALDAAAALDCSTFNVTINVQDGTWAENVALPFMLGSGTFTLQSTSGNASACIISPAAGGAVVPRAYANWWLRLMELRSPPGANECLDVAAVGSRATLQSVDFGLCGRHQVNAENGGQVFFAGGGYTVRGNATLGSHLHAARGGYIQSAAIGTITVTGRRTFSTGFVQAETDAQMFAPGLTFAGDPVTFTVASPGTVNQTGHGGSNDDPVIFKGTIPPELTAGTIYFKRSVAANTYQVSATAGGASINFSGAGSGAQTAISIVSGVRFNVSSNALIQTSGSGVSYFPGAAAGTGDPGAYDGYT